MTLDELDALSTFSLDEFQYITEDPVNFDLFFCGVFDHWYQQPVIRDEYDAIAAVMGRQLGKTAIIARRENYNGATNFECEKLEATIIAPAQRQSENLYNRCKTHLEASPILLSQLKHGRVLMKGIEWENNYLIRNVPVGQSAVTSRGYTLDELVYEEAAYVPGAVFDAMSPSLLSSAGVEVRIGTPNGKANYLYMAFQNAYQIHTIPEKRWESWDITQKDQVIHKMKDIDMDEAFSCHHYPSHVGLNCFKDFNVYPEEAWIIKMKNRRFKKKHRGWLVIKTEQKQFIGQLLHDNETVWRKLPEEMVIKYDGVKNLLDSPLHVIVAFPQVSPKHLKRELKKDRSHVEREILALFSDEDGTVFPYQFVQRVFDKHLDLWNSPRKGFLYYGGLDIAKGVKRDFTVITIIAYKKPHVYLVYQWKTDRRRIKEAEKMLFALHKAWHVVKWYVDSNTLGARTLEEMEDVLGSNTVDGIGFQIKDKNELVSNTERLLGDEHDPCYLHIPAIMTQLKHQFEVYQKETSQDGRTLKYHHPDWEGEHDDELVSFMLACLCAKIEEVHEIKFIKMPRIWDN